MESLRPIAWAALLLACLVFGCGGKEKENLEKFDRAQALFEIARRSVPEGKLDEAHAAYCQAQDVLQGIRRRSGSLRMGESDLPAGPRLRGLTARQWQEQWSAEMQMIAERSFDALAAKAAAGGLDWSRGRTFLNTYAPGLDSRWVELAPAAASSTREGEFYLFECRSEELKNCDTLRRLVASKAARPVSNEKFVTGGARSAAFGLIQIKVELLDWQSYGQPDPKNPNQSLFSHSIPARACVKMAVRTREGSSSWDGESRFNAVTELPSDLSGSAILPAKKNHLAILQQSIEQQFSDIMPQVLQ